MNMNENANSYSDGHIEQHIENSEHLLNLIKQKKRKLEVQNQRNLELLNELNSKRNSLREINTEMQNLELRVKEKSWEPERLQSKCKNLRSSNFVLLQHRDSLKKMVEEEESKVEDNINGLKTQLNKYQKDSEERFQQYTSLNDFEEHESLKQILSEKKALLKSAGSELRQKQGEMFRLKCERSRRLSEDSRYYPLEDLILRIAEMKTDTIKCDRKIKELSASIARLQFEAEDRSKKQLQDKSHPTAPSCNQSEPETVINKGKYKVMTDTPKLVSRVVAPITARVSTPIAEKTIRSASKINITVPKFSFSELTKRKPTQKQFAESKAATSFKIGSATRVQSIREKNFTGSSSACNEQQRANNSQNNAANIDLPAGFNKFEGKKQRATSLQIPKLSCPPLATNTKSNRPETTTHKSRFFQTRGGFVPQISSMSLNLDAGEPCDSVRNSAITVESQNEVNDDMNHTGNTLQVSKSAFAKEAKQVNEVTIMDVSPGEAELATAGGITEAEPAAPKNASPKRERLNKRLFTSYLLKDAVLSEKHMPEYESESEYFTPTSQLSLEDPTSEGKLKSPAYSPLDFDKHLERIKELKQSPIFEYQRRMMYGGADGNEKSKSFAGAAEAAESDIQEAPDTEFSFKSHLLDLSPKVSKEKSMFSFGNPSQSAGKTSSLFDVFGKDDAEPEEPSFALNFGQPPDNNRGKESTFKLMF